MRVLSEVFLCLLVAGCESSSTHHRKLSFERFHTFSPQTLVTDHAAIDLDQKEIEFHLGTEGFPIARAQNVYENGGHSRPTAVITFAPALTISLSAGQRVTGTAVDGTPVSGTVVSDVGAGGTSVEIRYTIGELMATYVRCQVGGKFEPVTAGCFAENSNLTVGGQQVPYTTVRNINTRTIKGFSVRHERNKKNDGEGEYFRDFKMFLDYYGDPQYSDKLITAAFTQTQTQFSNFNFDFRTVEDVVRNECVKKGTAYMTIFMYVIRELEDALDDCERGCDRDECNDDAVHALDEAVAFYSGSLLITDKASDGVLLWSLAQKRCTNYNTCQGTVASVNEEIFVNFKRMQDQLLKKECAAARVTKERIVDLMFVPPIQGTLRYAYQIGEQSNTASKNDAEGAIFAAAVLPRIHACNAQDARLIADNMRLGPNTVDFLAVKRAFEKNYACMRITCADVGGLTDGANYFPKAQPCSGSFSLAAGVGIVLSVLAVFF